VLEAAGYAVDVETLMKVTPLVQTRITTLNDVVKLAGFFFREDFNPPKPEEVIQKKLDAARTKRLLQRALEVYTPLPESDWTMQPLYDAALPLTTELEMSNSQVFGALRVAVTGQTISTPTFETMEIIGKSESLRRIQLAAEML
jgi:glutamyl-tRNA synthetase